MNVDQHLVNVVNMLTKDENMPEANSNEDTEMPKLTVFDDCEEMMKGKAGRAELTERIGYDDSCKKVGGSWQENDSNTMGRS